jgi:hypothetical protein
MYDSGLGWHVADEETDPFSVDGPEPERAVSGSS